MTLNAIKNDNICVNTEVLSAKHNGRFNITVKCKDKDNADKLEQALSRKYANSITVKQVQQVRIIRLQTELNIEEITEQLVRQNR